MPIAGLDFIVAVRVLIGNIPIARQQSTEEYKHVIRRITPQSWKKTKQVTFGTIVRDWMTHEDRSFLAELCEKHEGARP
eukprot:2070816-Amphidinium_carterae.1